MKISLSTCLLFSQALASSVPALRSGIKPKRHAETQAQLRQRGAPKYGSKEITTPKLFILSMFTSEANTWYDRPDIDLLAQNITVPGFSPLFPEAHCTSSGEICQMTAGEGEINAASSIMALWMSGKFDLEKTYFLIAGIGGVNPHVATTGSINFARFAVQLDLQYEFAQSQVPANWPSGYIPQGTDAADQYPTSIYVSHGLPSTAIKRINADRPLLPVQGTEVFELNDNLKLRAMALAKKATLNDTAAAQAYRATYGYVPASEPPTVVAGDSGTSNVYWSGSVLGDAFSAYTKLLTNGSGLYLNSNQEDNAVLESLMRGDLAEKLDLSRVILMRTASDFDRAPPGETETFHLLEAEQEGFGIAIENLYVAGIEIVKDVLIHWDDVYKSGIKADNYVGDLFNSLNSEIAPDIGTEAIYIN